MIIVVVYVLPVVWALDSLLWAKFPGIVSCFSRLWISPMYVSQFYQSNSVGKKRI
ncbi:unnamed protein product [Brassica napus]|uniref:(rape) hypothetical protein n=1 Tax=Brassica napus TaxID=3708 RepID=A0A816Q812_BRANA|nr:unnamed protein product [Brassica napus]